MIGDVIATVIILLAAGLVVFRFLPSGRKRAAVSGCGSCSSCRSHTACDSRASYDKISDSMVRHIGKAERSFGCTQLEGGSVDGTGK